MEKLREEDWRIAKNIDRELLPQYQKIDDIVAKNQEKVLSAFWQAKVGDHQLWGSTGYGYGDRGREQLEAVYAAVFSAEEAIVRSHIVSGTHALTVALFGLLRPGDDLIYATGQPYDTLLTVIGNKFSSNGSLHEYGIGYKEVPLHEEGGIDIQGVLSTIDHKTKVVAFQRSPGYSLRKAFSVREINQAVMAVKEMYPEVYILVDNCYGEFTEEMEPSEYDVDLVVGSLIKNPGGGLAPTGGYIVGKRKAIQQVSYRLTAPGIGRESGSYENYRLFYQGLFLAPHVVGQALKGNLFASSLLQQMGYQCEPSVDSWPRDIVLKIKFGEKDKLIAFCQAIQSASPIDAHVVPEPWQMPGYQDPVIMASGSFIQGSSIELSADGPIRPPFVAYMQGGLTLEHVKIAMLHVMRTLNSMS